MEHGDASPTVTPLPLLGSDCCPSSTHSNPRILLRHERQTLTSVVAVMAPPHPSSFADLYSEMEARYFQRDAYLSVIARRTEFEADEVGLQLAALAGFDSRRQLEFMQKLACIVDTQLMRIHSPGRHAQA